MIELRGSCGFSRRAQASPPRRSSCSRSGSAPTAIFSLVEAILIKPLPYPDPDRLVVFHNVKDGEPLGPHSSSWPDFEDWRTERGVLESMALFSYWTFNVTDRDVPARITGGRVTGNFFSTVGAAPLLGRVLTPEDDHPGGEEAVVFELWRMAASFRWRRGRARADAHPQRARPHTVVGVMPRAFRFPEERVEIWGGGERQPASSAAT